MDTEWFISMQVEEGVKEHANGERKWVRKKQMECELTEEWKRLRRGCIFFSFVIVLLVG